MPNPTSAEKVAFVQNFKDAGQRFRNPFEPTWEELYSNYRVEPFQANSDQAQLGIGQYNNPGLRRHGQGTLSQSVLKHHESHQIVESLLAQILITCFGPSTQYILAEPVGREDVPSAKTLSRLILYALERPNHYLTMYEVLKDALIFGTGIMQLPWEFVERNGRIVMDDPGIQPVSLFDFYPDPSATRISEMVGVVKRFTMTQHEAFDMAERGIFNKDIVRKAIERADNREHGREDDSILALDNLSASDLSLPAEYKRIEGYEFWGVDVPWEPTDGMRSRVITTLVDVPEGPARDAPSPFEDGELPFAEFKINPIAGRFYGLSPLEVTRFSQDFQDTIMMSRADSIVREIKGQWEVLEGFVEDPDKLRVGMPGDIHMVQEKDAIRPLDFNHTLNNSYIESSVLSSGMKQASGALDPLQGISSGGSQTATEIATVAQRALTRVNMTCTLLEREYLPRIARLVHSRFVQFIDEEGLQNRVGIEPRPVTMEELSEAFNYRFIGSNLSESTQNRGAALREAITVLGSIPFIAAQVNWQSLITKYLEDGLKIRDFGDFIAAPEEIADNVGLQEVLAQQGVNGPGGSIAAPQQRPQAQGRQASDVGGTLQ